MNKNKVNTNNNNLNITNKGSIKAQASIFIIIGLIAVIIIGFGAYFISQKPASIVEETPATLKEFVERCVYDTAFNGIMLLGIQGGRIYTEQTTGENVEEIDKYMLDVKNIGIDGSVAYGYYDDGNKNRLNNKNKLLSSVEMEAEINKYVNNALPFCIKNFTNFPQQVVEQGAINADVMIALDKVIITVNYPLKYGSNTTNNIQTLDKFVVDVPIRLGYVHEIARLVVVEQIKQPDLVDFTFLSELSDGTFNASELGTSILLGYSLNSGMKDAINIIPVDKNNFLLAINYSGFVFLSAFKFKENKAPKIIIDDKLFSNDADGAADSVIYLNDGKEFVCSAV